MEPFNCLRERELIQGLPRFANLLHNRKVGLQRVESRDRSLIGLNVSTYYIPIARYILVLDSGSSEAYFVGTSHSGRMSRDSAPSGKLEAKRDPECSHRQFKPVPAVSNEQAGL
jgi:hypothetical protein